jgi:hypothetical protein
MLVMPSFSSSSSSASSFTSASISMVLVGEGLSDAPKIEKVLFCERKEQCE